MQTIARDRIGAAPGGQRRLTAPGCCGMKRPANVCRERARRRKESATMANDRREPKAISRDQVPDAEALKPGYNWSRQIPAHGHSAVDFEERVNFRRLHDYRLPRPPPGRPRPDPRSGLRLGTHNTPPPTTTV